MVLRPSRGEIWLADLDPTRGHEQMGWRPLRSIAKERLHGPPWGKVSAATMRQVEDRLRILISL